MQKKANPIDVKIELVNHREWKDTRKLHITINGLFRDSSWRIKDVSHKISANEITIAISSKKLGGMALMVLTPFEVNEEVELKDVDIKYKIRVFIDGDECAVKKV
ncbi:MAG: hypothetical protein ACTSQI_02785 [Candidatus Helarchaeota archaeon]